MVRSSISNAEDKSSKVIRIGLLSSREEYMSSNKESKVVSVLCNFLNPFCLLSSRLCSVKYDSSWTYTVFSSNLANSGIWEIGR